MNYLAAHEVSFVGPKQPQAANKSNIDLWKWKLGDRTHTSCICLHFFMSLSVSMMVDFILANSYQGFTKLHA